MSPSERSFNVEASRKSRSFRCMSSAKSPSPAPSFPWHMAQSWPYFFLPEEREVDDDFIGFSFFAASELGFASAAGLASAADFSSAGFSSAGFGCSFDRRFNREKREEQTT